MMGEKKRALTAILGSDPREQDEKEGQEMAASDAELHAIAHELVEAVHARNVPDVMAALKSFFYCCDSLPHEEGSHEE